MMKGPSVDQIDSQPLLDDSEKDSVFSESPAVSDSRRNTVILKPNPNSSRSNSLSLAEESLGLSDSRNNSLSLGFSGSFDSRKSSVVSGSHTSSNSRSSSLCSGSSTDSGRSSISSECSTSSSDSFELVKDSEGNQEKITKSTYDNMYMTACKNSFFVNLKAGKYNAISLTSYGQFQWNCFHLIASLTEEEAENYKSLINGFITNLKPETYSELMEGRDLNNMTPGQIANIFNHKTFFIFYWTSKLQSTESKSDVVQKKVHSNNTNSKPPLHPNPQTPVSPMRSIQSSMLGQQDGTAQKGGESKHEATLLPPEGTWKPEARLSILTSLTQGCAVTSSRRSLNEGTPSTPKAEPVVSEIPSEQNQVRNIP